MSIDAFYIEYLIRAHMNSATECYDLHVEIIKRYEMRKREREREMCTMSDKIFAKKQIQIDEGAYTSEMK